jgi:MspA
LVGQQISQLDLALRTVSRVRRIAVVVHRVAVVAVCFVMSVTMAPPGIADPDAEPAAAEAPPAAGQVPSADPATLNTPDGWILTLGAKDESQVPVAPLTTAVSSREYLASGTFVASLKGPEPPRGVLEVGYEIGCGIDMSTSNGVTMAGSQGLSPGLGFTGLFTGVPGVVPLVTAPMNGVLSVGLKPGLVIVVPVVKKQFKGPDPWVMISNFHVKIDGCVGQSFIRSYATLTRVTDESDVVLSYVGVTKAV